MNINGINISFSHSLSTLILIILLVSCTSEKEEPKDTKTEPDTSATVDIDLSEGSDSETRHVDSTSAPLYKATRDAKAVDLELNLLNGDTFRISEQEGKVLLINIWATWCQPCHAETPDLVDLYNEYKDEGFVILGVSTDEKGKEVVQDFIDKYNVPYPIYIDDKKKVEEEYGPYMAIPTTYIINKDGLVRYFATGAVTRKELEPRIKKLLNE